MAVLNTLSAFLVWIRMAILSGEILESATAQRSRMDWS